jgi:hypothetical protein
MDPLTALIAIAGVAELGERLVRTKKSKQDRNRERYEKRKSYWTARRDIDDLKKR